LELQQSGRSSFLLLALSIPTQKIDQPIPDCYLILLALNEECRRLRQGGHRTVEEPFIIATTYITNTKQDQSLLVRKGTEKEMFHSLASI